MESLSIIKIIGIISRCFTLYMTAVDCTYDTWKSTRTLLENLKN